MNVNEIGMSAQQVERYRARLHSRAPLIGPWLRRQAAEALARAVSPAAAEALAEALARSTDERVRAIARAALEGMNDRAGVGRVYRVWKRTQHPALAHLLVESAWVPSDPEVAGEMAQWVVKTADESVLSTALVLLRRIGDQVAVDAVCNVWAGTRHALLSDLLAECGWTASAPVKLRVLTALQAGRPDALASGGPEIVEPLLEACREAEPLGKRAQQVLRGLEDVRAREFVCRLYVEHDDPVAGQVALEAGYLPADAQQRALFLFLTRQWERYDLFDFDRQFLRAAYAEAGEPLRARIREGLRAAGRADFLGVIAGNDYRDGVAQMSTGELDLLLQTLLSNHAWPALWKLVFDVPFLHSARAMDGLVRAGWRPEGEGSEDDQPVFDELAAYVRQGLPADLPQALGAFQDELLQYLQSAGGSVAPVLLRAQARVLGRINDVAFSPTQPIVAVGTGRRRVVLWNYQRARRERVLDELDRSIGCVAFTRQGTLLCAERTRAIDAHCRIYGWDDDGRRFHLGGHTGSVTALTSLGENLVLSAGRDGRVILWDVPGRQAVQQVQFYRQGETPRFHHWARGVCVSPGGHEAALVSNGMGVDLVTLPELENLRVYQKCSLASQVAFAPQNEGLVIGLSNAGVGVYRFEYKMVGYPDWLVRLRKLPPHEERLWLVKDGTPMTRHAGRLKNVTTLHWPAVIVSAASDGSVHFTAYERRSPICRVQVPEGEITSLHVSADESFMAVGSAAALLSFWDLRLLSVRGLLACPFAGAWLSILPLLDRVEQDGTLSAPLRAALRYVACALRHRFRFDVEIESAPEIMMGEFDIEVD